VETILTGNQGDAGIRPAAASDLDTIVRLTNEAYAVYDAVLDRPAIPVTEDYAPHIAKGNVWLLEADKQSAGLIVVERKPDHLLIFSVVVADAYQGRGFGSRLMRWAETLARRQGLDLVRLYTNARMTRNIAIYEGLGYREIGRRTNANRPGWVVVDMEKRLI
jgi:ribosomal protein S18 acetylase RimI-like enzyme